MTNIVTKMIDRLRLGPAEQSRLGVLCAPVLLTLLLMASPSGWAAEGNTYEVRVDVASRSLDDRRLAAQEGLRTVLTRLTGQLALPDSAALRAALRAPDDYYSRFRYLRSDRYDDLGNPVTVLSLGFSPSAVRRLMSSAQLPLWTLNRPTVVAWVADMGTGGGDLLADPGHPLLAALVERANFRGLPLVLPTLAGEDVSQVGVRDVTGRRQARLLAAAERYDAQIVLVGEAQQSAVDEWRVRWTSWIDGGTRSQSLNGAPNDVTHSPVDVITDALASRFTVAGGEVGMLRLEISEVASVADYGGVLRYLESLSYVDNVTLVGVSAGGLEIDVATSSSAEKFMELLAIESRLAQQPARFTNPRPAAGGVTQPLPETPLDRVAPSTSFAGPVLRVAWQG